MALLTAKAATLMAVLLALGTREWLFRRGTALSAGLTLLLVAALYGYGASATINATFDETRGRAFRTRVRDKHTTSGKTTTYYLTVGPWGPFTEANDVQVSSDYYQLMRPGSQVRIRLKPGRLGVPWYTVE